MATIDDRKNAVREEYGYFGTPQELFEYIIAKNKAAPPLEKEFKSDDYLVRGCVSSLWLVPSFSEGKCRFKSDADSVITRGIASLVCSVYDGLTPAEVLSLDPAFFDDFETYEAFAIEFGDWTGIDDDGAQTAPGRYRRGCCRKRCGRFPRARRTCWR